MVLCNEAGRQASWQVDGMVMVAWELMVLSPASQNAPPLTKEWFFFYAPLPIAVPNFPLVAHEVSILFLSTHSLQAPRLLYKARAILFYSIEEHSK